MTLIVGLTGGIGSGKSTVAKLFEQLDIAVYYTDNEAKKLMLNSKYIRKKLIEKFGEKVYHNQQLNKTFLANLIFTKKENLDFVNSIVHPKVNQHFKKWVKKKEKVATYVIQENAILFENGSDKYCDYIIAVIAPEEERINRVVKRDRTTRQKVKERIDNQWSDEIKAQKSNFIIHNIELKKTKAAVLKIYKNLIKLALDCKKS